MSLAALLAKDLRRDARRLEGVGTALILTGLLYFLALFALPATRQSPGTMTLLLWVPVVVGASLAATRGLAREAQDGTLDLLRLAPVAPVLHGLSRTLADGVTTTLMAAASVTLLAGLYGASLSVALLLTIALGVIGITVVTSLAGGIAGLADDRGLLAPVLAVPALAPHLNALMDATTVALAEGQMHTDALVVLVGLNLVAAALAWFLWPSLIGGDAS